MSSLCFDITAFGATPDDESLDTEAINRAIEAAAAAGGGTVAFPAGTFRSHSLRLRSHVSLYLGPGATLRAADPPAPGEPGGYDPAEPNPWGDVHRYQDFGHSHWHNSLIWGEGLENVSIIGPGRIDGRGLSRGDPRGRSGVGNKAIALKLCRNVLLRDFSILDGGHFAVLATGVDNLTIDNLRVDTDRDGFDIDCCRNVRIANCTVNAPNDDAIVLKSSYALGEARATENVTITNCQVSGYNLGSLLDGTFLRTQERSPDRDGPTGRIKLGTESNGGFKNITISNCVFDRSRGLALETVDGGVIEDIAITNVTMRDVTTAPLFLRIGNRARGPEGTPVGAIRRVSISHLVVSGAESRYAAIIAGLPGHPVEDVRLSDIRIHYRGGITLAQVAAQPAELVNSFFLRGAEPGVRGPREIYAVPERPKGYPEPSMFGLLPAAALYVRHAKNLHVRDLQVSWEQPDERATIVLEDVAGATFDLVHAPRVAKTETPPTFVLREVRDFAVRDLPGLKDARIAVAKEREL